MLSPAHPLQGDPQYAQRLRQYREDLRDKARHPQNWGMVRAETPAPPRKAARTPSAAGRR